MKKTLLLNFTRLFFLCFLLLGFAYESSAQIIISQVYEGSGNNKWIEITNVGSTSIDLASPIQYKVGMWNITSDTGNATLSGSPTSSINLSGTLSPGGIYLLKNTSSSTAVPHSPMPTANNSNNTVNSFNGNDALAIFTGTSTIVDAFGAGINNKDISYHRNANVLSSNDTFTTSEWTSKTLAAVASADNTLSEYIGVHVYGTTTWNGTSWSNGTPSASLDAIITQDYSTGAASPQGSFTAKSLTVNSGIFTVASGTSVTIENAIVNNAGSNNFIVENNANLIQTNAVANTGAIKVKRNSNPLYRYDYTLWSSPVIGQNLKAFSSGTLSNRFYLYNTATNTNGEYETVFPAQDEAAYNFAAGSGYLIRTSDSHPVYVEGNSGTAINAEFIGVRYNQALNVTLSNANTGFNLVGNPYTSAISISQLFSQNSNAIDGTIWFWRKRNGATGSGYATSTGMGVTSLHSEATAINTNGVIGTGQGFFVKVKADATQNTLNFSNTLRSNNTGGSFFRSAAVTANSQDVERHRIWLNLSNGTEVVGQTLLGYMTEATSGVDYGIEGKYFNDSPIAFTSYVENQEFAIQGRSLPFVASDIVPMAFKTDVAGNYSIAIDHVDGFFAEDQDIYLKDNFTGQIHDIKSSSYSFSSESGVFNNRFEVVYQSQLSVDVPQISTNSIVVYKQNGNLVVNAGNYMMSKIELYDVSGRLVYTKNNIGAAATVIGNLSIANQVLVVKITTEENGVANKKIVY